MLRAFDFPVYGRSGSSSKATEGRRSCRTAASSIVARGRLRLVGLAPLAVACDHQGTAVSHDSIISGSIVDEQARIPSQGLVRAGDLVSRGATRRKIVARLPKPKKKVTWPQARAFSVHLLTASGSFLAFLSLVAASEQRWAAMFWWLGLALLVDGIDGPIARKLDVKEVLPTWSGELLDNIIDYVTYVLIPAFALYQRGFMGRGSRSCLPQSSSFRARSITRTPA